MSGRQATLRGINASAAVQQTLRRSGRSTSFGGAATCDRLYRVGKPHVNSELIE